MTRLQFLYYLGVEESQQRPDRVAEIADELQAYPLYAPLSWQIRVLAGVHLGDVREAARCREQRELSLLGSAVFASHISAGIHYEAAGHALTGGSTGSVSERAELALALLIEESGATGGALYLVRSGTLELAAARQPAPPELKQALGHYLAGHLGEATMTKSDDDLVPMLETTFADPHGNRFQLLMLSAEVADETPITGGVALCHAGSGPLRLGHALTAAIAEYLAS